MIRYIDLFCGIGGFHQSMDRIGYEYLSECVFSCEIDNRLRGLYSKNYSTECYGDIYDIDISESIGSFDLLMGGFPCQSFSIGGNRGGFDDARGLLIHRIIEILSIKQPKYFLLENVENILHIDGGRVYSSIMEMLSSCGYICKTYVYSPECIGKPYIRNRVYFLGIRSDLGISSLPDDLFKCCSSDSISLEDLLVYGIDDLSLCSGTSYCLSFWEDLLSCIDEDINRDIWLYSYDNRYSFPSWVNKATMEYSIDFVSRNYVIIDSVVKRHPNIFSRKCDYVLTIKNGYNFSSLRDCVIQSRQSVVRCNSLRVIPTIVRQNSQIPIIYDPILSRFRHLNSIELKRLHGLDESIEYPSSKSGLSKAIGNSISVDVVSKLLLGFFDYVKEKRGEV